MKLKQFIAKAMFAGGLGLTAVGLGMGAANADRPLRHQCRHRLAFRPLLAFRNGKRSGTTAALLPPPGSGNVLPLFPGAVGALDVKWASAIVKARRHDPPGPRPVRRG